MNAFPLGKLIPEVSNMEKKKVEKEFPEHITWPVNVDGTLSVPGYDRFSSFIGIPNNPYEPLQEETE